MVNYYLLLGPKFLKNTSYICKTWMVVSCVNKQMAFLKASMYQLVVSKLMHMLCWCLSQLRVDVRWWRVNSWLCAMALFSMKLLTHINWRKQFQLYRIAVFPWVAEFVCKISACHFLSLPCHLVLICRIPIRLCLILHWTLLNV